MDAPANLRPELGMESQFFPHGDALPGRHGIINDASLTGNPDFRVPEELEIDDGLRVRRGIEEEVVDSMDETPRGGILNIEEKSNQREALHPNVHDRIEDREETEKREPRHVPGGTWLNQTDAPANLRPESGTESRFFPHGDALPGRHGIINDASLTGNPDFRVPEELEIDDGLRARRGIEEEVVESMDETPRGGILNIEEKSNQREALHPNVQDRIEDREETEKREPHHVPGGTWHNQTDAPANLRPESGTESRFFPHGDALPGRHGIINDASLTGNPDFRVPEEPEIDDGLRARRGIEEEVVESMDQTPRGGIMNIEEKSNQREALHPNVQDRIEDREETEKREPHHVPGGTWHNQTHPYLHFSCFRCTWESSDEYLRQSRGNLGKEKKQLSTENPHTL
ncbi:hypothetical protein NDU88_008045 [Pleurodeles waltl]|uniref:Uncharacterized protein n=1 Tax=Pleurodeles waltl TaxID=8319 RepID=A0AAV7RVS0_PLEWA|nr:hypothetical protein NDU88_008045 [Pleurodeles waltl]